MDGEPPRRKRRPVLAIFVTLVLLVFVAATSALRALSSASAWVQHSDQTRIAQVISNLTAECPDGSHRRRRPVMRRCSAAAATHAARQPPHSAIEPARADAAE